MSYRNKLIAAGFAVLASLGMAGAAKAVEASATVSLNVRSGPGTSYRVIDTLYQGEVVDVAECESNGWCRIVHSGPDGWVSSSYLVETDGRRSGSSRVPPRRSTEPDVDFNFGFDSDGNFSFGIGVGEDNDRRRPDRNRRASACFYDGSNYRGDSFCVRGDDRDGRLGAWDNRISSFELSRGASVTLCTGSNLSGFCRTYSRSDRSLGYGLNNRVSSYRVNY